MPTATGPEKAGAEFKIQELPPFMRTMSRCLCRFALAVMAATTCFALPEDPAEYAAWERETLQAIQEHATKPPEEAIPKLGLLVVQLSRPHREWKEGKPVLTAARQALISIPGHADYFAKKITDAQKEVEDNRGGYHEGTFKSKLLAEQMYSFQKLEQLPSPETVRVLGEFLFDPWGLNKDAKPGEKPNNDRLGESSNATLALQALSRLPLETRANATPAGKTNYWADIDAWKLWYSQIKAGTRTFRFEGDPRNCSLNGPVTAAIDPTVERVSKRLDGKGDASPIAADAAVDGKVSGGIWGPLLAMSMILGLAGWYFTMKRKKAG